MEKTAPGRISQHELNALNCHAIRMVMRLSITAGWKNKKAKNIPCYVILHLILVVELRRKSSKSSKSKLPFTPHHRKTECQFVCHFVFLSEAWKQFSSLKTYLHCTSFQFTMYNSSCFHFTIQGSKTIYIHGTQGVPNCEAIKGGIQITSKEYWRQEN